MIAPFLDAGWVSATATSNWCHQDPLLDWLELYGTAHGFKRDKEYEGYDSETDMGLFMREKGRAFETGVMRCLQERGFQIVRIAEGSRDALDPLMLDRTLEAMRDQVEILYQPVVWDSARQCHGMPDLLVRSDVLNRLTEQPVLSEAEIPLSPPGERVSESANWGEGAPHYRVVDIKFTGLDLTAKGLVGNDGADRRRKAQLLVYNRALGEMQGFEPPHAYLLGRGWKQTIKKETSRGDTCFDRLAPADMYDPELAQLADAAIAWIRRVREEGKDWQVLPRPSVSELYPNMSNTQDSPWHMTKKEIADQIGELTLLWRVTPNNRPIAHQAGVIRFSDDRCQGDGFGLADSYAAKLQQILEINRDGCPDLVRPRQVAAGGDEWRAAKPLEFYVDFETVTDLDDDFSALPKKGGQTLIYMIGCGHMEAGAWRFTAFTCDRLTPDCERAIIDAWHEHMRAVRQRLWPEGDPLVFHWSHAEQSFLNTAYNSARTRHQAAWPDLNWYDFLVKVMREEPVTVKGALAFGLKSIAKGMHKNGLIKTNWTNGPGDGLGAMIGAWRCDVKARDQNCSMKDLPLMRSIEDYNQVDCRVMQEIIAYLRANH